MEHADISLDACLKGNINRKPSNPEPHPTHHHAAVLLVSKHPVDGPRTVVPLADHGTNLSTYLLGLFTRLLIYVKTSKVSGQLCLDMIPDPRRDILENAGTCIT